MNDPGSYLPALRVLYFTARSSVEALATATAGGMTFDRGDEIVRRWARDLVDAAGARVRVEGADNWLRTQACILMSNHQSHFDIPILFTVFPGSLRMVAKKELFRIPLWGQALRRTGFISIDRSGGRAEARAAMDSAGQKLDRGVSIWIAPEGTRSEDGTLRPFKKGGFHLARETGQPIVPVVLSGSRDILPKHDLRVRRGVDVRVTVGPAIDGSGRDVADLMAEVRAFMERTLDGS